MLELKDICVTYASDRGQVKAVDHVSLRLQTAQIGCLLGASGCGKSTILRVIAGFEPLNQGVIYLENEPISTTTHVLAPEKRRMGMMFQDYALFPHLNVEDNIGFGLRKLPRAERAARVSELLHLVGLTDYQTRLPHELSGGQQQRVALARALAPSPALLLLDEPFSNLDVSTRERLAFELRQILKQAGQTALLVTHNHDEAFAIADQIGVMQQGQLLQWGSAKELLERPANEAVNTILRRDALAREREEARTREQ